ncbi:hypothetical protein [Aeoliella mucimassa]|uniref:Uncharacterized protein n=1 Tax=Aeoliella mucimassa TaxID=2527972 RepID=A0A518AHZ3_9BACT|nr:hypothetical protein [Aeoliella mucimassa]QDU54347.1 hypothetical protein Pan181_05280 [Aeoliella mucimassa]
MIDQCLAVLHTYTTRRMLMLALAVGGIFETAMLIMMTGGSGPPDKHMNGLTGMNQLGLPLMLGGFLIAVQAKFQFVHPRARLMPNYRAPHLAVLVLLLTCLGVVLPLLVSACGQHAVLGILAFSWLFLAIVIWQMQTMSGVMTIVSLALYFSFFNATAAYFWMADDAALLWPRIGLMLVGLTGIVAWFWRLTQMREQDSDYLVPVQSGFTQQSRMEKSEGRQLISRWVTRRPLMRWITDSWHDRLATISTPDEATRPRLLRYGMGMMPAPVMAVNVLLIVLAITTVQTFIVGSMNQGDSGASKITMLLATQGAIFCAMAPMFASQAIAIRRTRLGQDLLLPLRREALVDGLLRQFVLLVLWAIVPMAAMVLATTMAFAPEQLTARNIAAALITGLAMQPLLVGLPFRFSLISSGLKRLVLMILTLYLLFGIAAGVFLSLKFVGYAMGICLAAAVVVVGLLSVRWARSVWLAAELG